MIDINKYLQEAIPPLNKVIDNAILKAKLDPYQNVAHFEKEIGSITILEEHYTATISASLTNLKGLSFLEIKQLSVEDSSTDFSGGAIVKGRFKMDFKNNPSLDVEGIAVAEVGALKKKVSIDATMTNQGSYIEGNFSLSAKVKLGFKKSELDITSLEIDNITLKVGETHLKFNAPLGIFDSLADKILVIAVEEFNKEFAARISIVLKRVIQSGIDSILPIDVK